MEGCSLGGWSLGGGRSSDSDEERTYAIGDKFRGFEMHLPQAIPPNSMWFPDATMGQGSYILIPIEALSSGLEPAVADSQPAVAGSVSSVGN